MTPDAVVPASGGPVTGGQGAGGLVAGGPVAGGPGGRDIWWTRRAVLAHVALVIWVPGCAVAAWWQVGIALGGDSLGWVYSVMWPCFAVFGTIFWWFLVHDDPDTLGARGLRRQLEAGLEPAELGAQARAGCGNAGHASIPDGGGDLVGANESEEEDLELAAYNAYLAQLAGKEKSWRAR
ncbi:MAG: hypothetical protein M1522_03270 [Actinobacteria bacterium]|nr:hypothetical protein [Actinomycetota bacterium]